MKRKTISVLLVVAMMVTLVGCGAKAGDGSKAIEDGDVALGATMEEQENSVFSEWLPEFEKGYYCSTNEYTCDYVQVTNDSVIVHSAEGEFEYSSQNSKIDRAENGVITITDGVRTLRIEGQSFVDDMGNPDDWYGQCWIWGEKVTVLNGIPLEGYVDIDESGTWGTIPLTEQLEEMIWPFLTEDYAVWYRQEGSSEKYDNYSINCYDEEGLLKREISVKVYEDAQQAEKESEYYQNHADEFVIQDNMFLASFDRDDEEYGKKDIASFLGFGVFGKHCRESDYQIVYYSKPYSLEEGLAYVEKMYHISSIGGWYENPETYESFSLSWGGTGVLTATLSFMNGNEQIRVTTENVRVEEDTLMAIGYDSYYGIACVIEVSFAEKANVVINEYEYGEEISFDNYDTKNVTVTHNFSMEKKSSVMYVGAG